MCFELGHDSAVVELVHDDLSIPEADVEFALAAVEGEAGDELVEGVLAIRATTIGVVEVDVLLDSTREGAGELVVEGTTDGLERERESGTEGGGGDRERVGIEDRYIEVNR